MAAHSGATVSSRAAVAGSRTDAAPSATRLVGPTVGLRVAAKVTSQAR
jgi:hypothetical protein